MTSQRRRYAVVDLFAGPGGLGEGFASHVRSGYHPFEVKLSIEKDYYAHKTLELRSFFRQFPADKVPDCYYNYLREVDTPEQSRRTRLFQNYPEEAEKVRNDVRLAELGKENPETVRTWLTTALSGCDDWVLIGGPPCQAYSVVGRSRNRRNKDYHAEKDHRQYLYLEYLQIIVEHRPVVFVMENVKGLLSATLSNKWIFSRMHEDLQEPEKALQREHRPVRGPVNSDKPCRYKLYSLTKEGEVNSLNLSDFVVYMEKFGVPQARHRVIILGVRDDIRTTPNILEEQSSVNANRVLDGLPRVRSGLSREEDSADAWRDCIRKMAECHWFDSLVTEYGEEIHENMTVRLKEVRNNADRGGEYIRCDTDIDYEQEWFLDSRLDGVCNHKTRGHIRSDLYRYFYAACFALRANIE